MPSVNSATEGPDPVYRTGAAARLAGIPVETLRVWERRYQVVGPRVSPRGHRLYSAGDVRRLVLIRQLVDLGNAIGLVAGLPLAKLEQMRSAATAASQWMPIRPAAPPRPVRVVLVGATLADLVTGDAAWPSTLEVVAACAGPAGATEELQGLTADVVAIALPTVQAEAATTIEALMQTIGARHAVIEYRFAPSAVLRALRDRGYSLAHAPLDADALERLCRAVIPPDAHPPDAVPPGTSRLTADAVAAPRFDAQSLTRLARALTTLHCECPRHLVELLQSVETFERYSAECANRSPADALLHRHLQHVAGSARVLFEDALIRVARAEGHPLPTTTDQGSRAA